MNEAKELAEQVGQFIEKLQLMPEASLIPGGVNKRWLAIGRTELQQGFMAVARSIAKPDFF